MDISSRNYAALAEEDTGQICFLMVPWRCAQVCIAYQEESHCCLTCWNYLNSQKNPEKILLLWRSTLPSKVKNNFGALWEVCLGFFSGFKQVVEAGALIFKVFSKNSRFDQLVLGQRFLYSCEFFFLSLLPRDLIVNICVFINNFSIHWPCVLVVM